MDLGDSKTIYTPEHVAVTYQLAGVGTRFVAALLDTCIQALAFSVLGLVIGVLAALVESVGRVFESRLWGTWWAIVLLTFGIFTLFWGYYLFWEVLWNGQTPGKRVVGLRVMRDGGFPIDFRAAFVRNIVRVADMLPLAYGVGIISMLLSKDSKRLGDYAAGTVVVVEPHRPVARPLPAAAAQPVATPLAAPAPPPPVEYNVIGDPALLSLRAITREQFTVVERFLARRAELPQRVRLDLARRIATPIAALVGFTIAEPVFPYERFLVEIAIAYRARPGV